MIKNMYRRVGLAAAVLSLAILVWSFDDDLFLISKNLDIFASVYKELSINYIDDINSTSIVKTGIDAMLENLDPFTEFVPESEIEDYKLKYVSTQYGGIGASIFSRDKKVVISNVLAGFPAQTADIRSGDELLKINNISLSDKTSDQVSQLLKGPKGSSVILLVGRNGIPQPMEKKLLRAEIFQPNVSYFGIQEGNIGYIRLDKFLENSAQEVKDALVELRKRNLNGIVLDLRSNGGGILQEAVKIVSLFVPRGIEVVSQQGKLKEKNINYRTSETPLEPDLPLIVLINARSASASEIVAGSLQDLDRAVIVGQRSYGKGLVQQAFNLPYNSLIKITIAKYFTPSGRCIQAVDYTHRNTDGNVEKVADSLLHAYKTRSGRTVYDGSGIYPDVLVPQDRIAAITRLLLGKLFIFDYANNYRSLKNTIADPLSFTLSDGEYADFEKYLTNKDYSYSSVTEKMLTELKLEAEKEKQMASIKAEYDALKAKLEMGKQNDLQVHKSEIKQFLESEIASRYQFEKGRIESNFKYDRELAEATKLIQHKDQIAAVLKGDGAYKEIGKPQPLLAAKTDDYLEDVK
ncbi:MAG: S41 family peptidase [Sphingobacteriaceae bacterium]